MPRVLNRVTAVNNSTFSVTESDPQVSGVEELVLSKIYDCDREVLAKAIATVLLSNTYLRVFDLTDNSLDCRALSCIFNSLESNNFLHTLELKINKCGLEGARALGNVLVTNRSLERLMLTENPLGCEGVGHIAESLKSNTLHKLDLTNTRCDNRGAKAIADMMLTNNTLISLFLGRSRGSKWLSVLTDRNANTVGKRGASAVALALENNRSLKELCLCGNAITDEALKCFANALLMNYTLQKLCVGCGTGDEMSRQSRDESESEESGDEPSRHSRDESEDEGDPRALY